MKREFKYAFQIDRSTIFEVEYYTLGTNSSPYFTTSAEVFNKPKTNYNRFGQCQEAVLQGKAEEFWHKWKEHHLKDISDDDYVQLLNDIEDLKKTYNYYYKIRDTFAGTRVDFTFKDLKELSKLKVKDDRHFMIDGIRFYIGDNHHKNEFEGKYTLSYYNEGYDTWMQQCTCSTKAEARKWARENVRYL